MEIVGEIEMEWNTQERESLGFPSFFQIHPIQWPLQVFQDGLEEMLDQGWAHRSKISLDAWLDLQSRDR